MNSAPTGIAALRAYLTPWWLYPSHCLRTRRPRRPGRAPELMRFIKEAE